MFITNCLIASYSVTLETEPHASLGCSAVSHYKLAHRQLNAAKSQLDQIPTMVSAGWGQRVSEAGSKCSSQDPHGRLRSGEVRQQRDAHSLSVVSPCISASSQPSRTVEQRISAPPASGPSILWRRHWVDIKGRRRPCPCAYGGRWRMGKGAFCIPVVVAGSQVSDVFLNEKVRLRSRESD